MKPEDLKPFLCTLAAIGQAAIKAGQILATAYYEASRAAYVESGAVLIYGDNDEGFLRWLGEVPEEMKRDREKEKAFDRESKAFDV